MKKTISINISGILFHIEEDGYATLKKYLEAINRHFSHYEDNQEIISDIENRIAEIFLSNLKNNKQVITADDVNALIEKMGTIADFKAIEEEEEPKKENTEKEEENDFYKYITPPGENPKGYKKLTRLENRKILGGVCAGLAHYLAIDPLWTRLVAILLLFSGKINFGRPAWDFLPWNFYFSLGAWALIAYIVLWVILPVSYEEPEDKHIKKLYRNPDDRTIGGVASGLAAYFKVEVLWVRLLFIGLIFAGGSGLVIYLILWIITPQAKSITERIQMKGGAITLDNIESTIRENMAPPAPKEESHARKVFLTPFRVLGKVIEGIGMALGPFGKFILSVVRVIFGLIIFLIGMSITITPLVLLGVYFELLPLNDSQMFLNDIPAQWITEILPVWLALSTGFAIMIPGIVILLLGISVIIRKSLIEGRFGLIVLGIWLLSIGIAAFQLPKTIAQFKNEATYTDEKVLDLSDGTLVIKSEGYTSNRGIYDMIQLQLTGTDGDDVVMVQDFKSKGRNHNDAVNNAKQIIYGYSVLDSILTMDRGINLESLDRYRGQKLKVTLEIPYDKPFIMDKSILPIIRNTLYRNGYRSRDVNSKNTWVFNEEGLLCLTCTASKKLTATDSLSLQKFSNPPAEEVIPEN